MNASVITSTRLGFNIAFSVLGTAHMADLLRQWLTQAWLFYCFSLPHNRETWRRHKAVQADVLTLCACERTSG
jgi:hypothetical protein